jgi:hypothetical protein
VLGGSPAIGDRKHDRCDDHKKPDVAQQRDHKNTLQKLVVSVPTRTFSVRKNMRKMRSQKLLVRTIIAEPRSFLIRR